MHKFIKLTEVLEADSRSQRRDGWICMVSTLEFLTYFLWDTKKSATAGETYWFCQKNMNS
jgi:hypothetical protein